MPDSEQVIREIAFEMAASSVRFGAGVTREVGMDLVDLGVRRALVVTDPNLTRLAPVHTVLAALDAAGVQAVRLRPGAGRAHRPCRSATPSISPRRTRLTGSSPWAAARSSTRPRPSTSTRPIRRPISSTTSTRPLARRCRCRAR